MTALSSDQEVTVLESLATLPPLPETAQKIIDAFGDEFIDARDVTNVVEEDAALSAKLLGLANSAYYGLAEPVDCLFDAVSRVIGVDTVRSVLLALAMQRSLDQRACPSFDAERFWRESLITAHCCKRIALRVPDMPDAAKRLAYVTGLCHNIGLMALAFLAPDGTDRVLREEPERHERIDSSLERSTGISHRLATLRLAERWGLPPVLTEAYRCRVDASAVVESKLGLVLLSATCAVGNLDIEDEHKFDLDTMATELGLAVTELQAMALPGERQYDQIEALARSMA